MAHLSEASFKHENTEYRRETLRVMHDEEGMTYSQIASNLGVSRTLVCAKVLRAREVHRRTMKALLHEPILVFLEYVKGMNDEPR